MKLASLVSIALAFGLLSQANVVKGEDHFLTIGGGNSPTGNQISLERNVHFFQEVIAEKYHQTVTHDIYFSDGKSPGRDLQFQDQGQSVPRVNALLAKLSKQTKYLSHRYRNHDIEEVQGESSRVNLAKWFDKSGKALKKGDRLFLYVTAHGGKSSDKEDPYNTKLYMWNQQSIVVKELAKHLDKISDEVPVVMVMVQCYAGGFANVIFNEADAEKGTSPANRCGFFATVHNRVAAGCTPDINEEDYQEYSSHFWAAISGHSRTGKKIESADYDKNGLISLDEAHAYALIVSSTIDISTKTSDAFLRTNSQLGDEFNPDLWTANSSIDLLLENATIPERTVVERLSKELELTETDRAEAAKQLADKLMKQKSDLGKERQKFGVRYGRAAEQIKRSVFSRWPELNNPWNPVVADLLLNDSETVVSMVENHRMYKEFDAMSKKIDERSNDSFDLDKRWVKCKRLIQTLENIARAANIVEVADEETIARFRKLQHSEAAVFGQASIVGAVADTALQD